MRNVNKQNPGMLLLTPSEAILVQTLPILQFSCISNGF